MSGPMSSLNANSNSIAYWIVRNIHATPGLLDRVRAEIAPFIHQMQGKVTFDMGGLMNKTPLLKSCYWESLRIDSGPWSFKHLQRDCVVEEAAEDCRHPEQSKVKSSKFALLRGECVLLPADLHHTDPKYWHDPARFIPERFMVRKEGAVGDEGKTLISEMKTIRPYGGGSTMCKGRLIAEREVLSFVGCLLMCWDLEPVGPSGWTPQGRRKTSGVASPKDDLRVQLTRRKW